MPLDRDGVIESGLLFVRLLKLFAPGQKLRSASQDSRSIAARSGVQWLQKGKVHESKRPDDKGSENVHSGD